MKHHDDFVHGASFFLGLDFPSRSGCLTGWFLGLFDAHYDSRGLYV